jgi:hypothetical protein
MLRALVMAAASVSVLSQHLQGRDYVGLLL